ncbi:MAG: inosine/xanthosine triphosphatase [Candidatus Aenigmarchaeota archaeon]|nr:inosine/xanthosine triphosphatase [Candidatus Aenigmarchaeota archaeon]
MDEVPSYREEDYAQMTYADEEKSSVESQIAEIKEDMGKNLEAPKEEKKRIKVAVGSRNPTKVQACQTVFGRALGDAEVISVEVDNKVSRQPMSEAEAVEGAINRAKNAQRQTGADYGVGMEGCIYETTKGYFLTGWCAVVGRKGNLGLGSGGHIEVPLNAVDMIMLKRKELGEAMDEITGEKNIKQRMGTIGILTKQHDDRESSWETALLYALAKIINPEMYEVVV